MDYLNENQRIRFPDPRRANPWGVVAQGGNLSPGMLLSAYEQGIFPWYEEEPILWFSPDPRFILYFDEFLVQRRLVRTIRNSPFTVTFDRDFSAVIAGCREPRRRSAGTWITPEMVEGYEDLRTLGRAHSVEVWDRDSLVGGLYGVAAGSCFSGESMFSRRRDAGKPALVALVGILSQWNLSFVDCQSYTAHLASFGAREIPREAYLEMIASRVKKPNAIPGDWSGWDGGEMVQRGLEISSANRRSLEQPARSS